MHPDTLEVSAESIRVEGIVQGVGFRPAVWRLAHDLDLRGWVLNDGAGVLISLWGPPERRDRFVAGLLRHPPALARIDRLTRTDRAEAGPPPADFRILESSGGDIQTGVAADAATCPDCLAEIFDPANRRHGYPFTNCTHCGPRLSIIRAIPYDRAHTSMAGFTLCAECLREYQDPADRRFHAQPNACPACGPRLWLETSDGERIEAGDAIAETAERIRRGGIVAIKGIGGFHLACDATAAAAVARLRERKHRYRKPFALMARDLAMVERHAYPTPFERQLLADRAAPIVLLNPDGRGTALAPELAPGQHRMGFMLPYTPLHHLLMARLEHPIVLTSGNRSDEPQCIANEEARARLRGIADAWLMHDRDIVNRLDDSVLHVAAGQPRLLRRARGHAPASLPLPPGFEACPEILAMGGELKNSFCLTKPGEAILSQHMGDLEDASTRADYHKNLALYRSLFRHRPRLIAVDKHPDYVSTQVGQAEAESLALPCIGVQHHHAHGAAVLAEHRWPLEGGPVLGIALDGLGYGDDGGLWGGEFLRMNYRASRRLGCFLPVAMPGSQRCMREPWRNAYAHLKTALGWDSVAASYGGLSAVQALQAKPLATLDQMIDRELNSPLASSCGRLFDAAAALLGLSADSVSFEGQAASELEALASRAASANPYGQTLTQHQGLWILAWAPLWRAFLDDLTCGTAPAIIAARFHQGVADAVATLAKTLCEQEQLSTVVLSGGSFQNRLLLEAVVHRLRDAGLTVLAPSRVPANDGGLALGQAVVAGARFLRDQS